MKTNKYSKLLTPIIIFGILQLKLIRSENCQASPRALLQLEAEKLFLAELNDYVTNMMGILDKIQKYATRNSEIYNSLETNYDEYLSHPINHYLMVKRSTLDIDDILEIINKPAQKLKEYVDSMRQIGHLSGRDTYIAATDGLLFLQKTYDLELEELVKGSLKSLTYKNVPDAKGEPLTANECFWFAAQSLRTLDNSVGPLWYTMAKKLKSESNNILLPSPNTDEIVTAMEIFIKSFNPNKDELGNKVESTEDSVDKVIAETMRGSLSTRNDSNSEYRPKLYDPYYTKEEMMEQYFRLCRGERLRPLEWEKGLKCVYFTGHNPYFLINPMKMEVVNDDPFITIFYNAIMDNEIEHFLNMSGQKLEPAKQFSNNGTSFTSSGRISDNTWISSSATNITAGLSKRLGRLLGLDITENDGSAEEYQVNSYAANGVYKPHHDYFLEEMTEKYQYRGHKPGNRIATFMYYLSDVPAGGATVFPTIGATIWPKKGSAVFWWNLKRDMSTDPLTLHGACPVLYGSKWGTHYLYQQYIWQDF